MRVTVDRPSLPPPDGALVRSPRIPAFLLSLAAVPAVIALPVITTPRAHPHPVRAAVRVLDALAAEHAATTKPFSLVGASWTAVALPAGAELQVRVHEHGAWSGWNSLSVSDAGPDTGSTDARHAAGRIATDPLWVGHADGVQTRVMRGNRPLSTRGLRLTLVDPGTSSADAGIGAAPAGTAEAAT